MATFSDLRDEREEDELYYAARAASLVLTDRQIRLLARACANSGPGRAAETWLELCLPEHRRPAYAIWAALPEGEKDLSSTAGIAVLVGGLSTIAGDAKDLTAQEVYDLLIGYGMPDADAKRQVERIAREEGEGVTLVRDILTKVVVPYIVGKILANL